MVNFWKKKSKEPNEVDDLIEKGVALFKLGKYKQAIAFFDDVLNIEPNNFFALYNKGLTLAQLDQFEEALLYYNESLKIKPRNVLAIANKGHALFSLGKPEEGMACFNEALEIEPEDVYTLDSKGLALDELGNHDQAIAFFDKVLQIDPSYVFALHHKGISLSKLGKHDQAKTCYGEVTKIVPNYENFMKQTLSAVHKENKEPVGNGMTFVFTVMPQIPMEDRDEITCALINKSDMLENFSEPTRKFEDEVDKTVVTIRFWNSKFVVTIDDPIYKELNEQYTNWVIEFFKLNNFDCTLIESGVLTDMPDDTKFAVYNFDDKLTPDQLRYTKDFILKHQSQSYRTPPLSLSPEMAENVRKGDELMKDVRFSMEDIKEMAKKLPTHRIYQDVKNPDEFYFRNRALNSSMIGEYEKSIEFCNEGLKINPKSPYLFYMKGRCEADIGNFNEGIKDLNIAIKLRSDFADAYVEFGFIHQKLNMPEEAKKYYEKARKIEPSITLPKFEIPDSS